MKHGRRFAELALAVSVVLLVAACGSGPGKPLPTWSPPTWMHGTWTGRTPEGAPVAITATVEVSAYNLKASFQSGGVEHPPLNLAELEEQRVADIRPAADQLPNGKQAFGVVITPKDGGPVTEFLCTEESSTTMACNWTQGSQDLGSVVLTKQPG